MKKRQFALDSLKGLSILAIMVYHFNPNILKGGYIGVPLFFLIAGYLMANKFSRMGKNLELSDYYRSRFFRLYPSLFIFIGLVSLWSYFFANRLIYGSGGELASIFLGYNNFWQISQNLSYFDRIANASAFTHLWFLAIQIQFYIIWPALFILNRWLLNRSNYGRYLFMGLAILSLISMTLLAIFQVDITTIYYHTGTRIGSILLGAWIGLNQEEIKQTLHEWLTFKQARLLFIALGLVNLLFAFFLDGQSGFTYIIGLNLVTILQALWLILAIQEDLGFNGFAKNPILNWLGTRSYELYLWHYSIFFLFRIKKVPLNIWSILGQIVLLIIMTELAHIIGNWVGKGWKNFKLYPKSIIYGSLVVFFTAYVGISLAVVVPIANPQIKTDLQGQLAENSELVANQSLETTSLSQEASPDETTLSDQSELPAGVEDATQLPVTMIGDSVMLGSFKELKAIFPNSYIDASESRQAWDLPVILNQLQASGNLADIVVIGLGTNGYFSEQTGQEVMNFLGPNRTVFWVNVYGEFLEWETATNEEIQLMAKTYPNFNIIDWQGLVSQHRDWLIEDGIHPEVIGRENYAQLVAETLRSVLE